MDNNTSDYRTMTPEQLLSLMGSLNSNNHIFTIDGNRDFTSMKHIDDSDMFANLIYEDEMGEDCSINIRYDNITEILVHNKTKTMTVSYINDCGEEEDDVTIDFYNIATIDPMRDISSNKESRDTLIKDIEDYVETTEWDEWTESTSELKLQCVTYNALIHLKNNTEDSLTLAGKEVPLEVNEAFEHLLGQYNITKEEA